MKRFALAAALLICGAFAAAEAKAANVNVGVGVGAGIGELEGGRLSECKIG